jgi:hypothetical protein
MEFKASLDETVLFELPTARAAEQLLAHLSPHRLAWLQSDDPISVVGVLLGPEADDFAQLLRSVQEWLDRIGFAAIRFDVDGRIYALEPRRVFHAGQAALAVG